jgi:hypothetical protein
VGKAVAGAIQSLQAIISSAAVLSAEFFRTPVDRPRVWYIMPNQLIADLLNAISIDEVMTDLARVCAYDRYQASLGIAQAADLVAERARSIGLAEVSVERYPADGSARWWSFSAPVSWTPTMARMEIRVNGSRVLEIDHAHTPFSIATNSNATASGGIVASLANVRRSASRHTVAGAIAVADRAEFASNDLLRDLIADGAIGFITDSACCVGADRTEYTGRIELNPNTPLFGFSVTSLQLELITKWADQGAVADVAIEVDRSSSMPVVTGVLPGEPGGEEVWLIAHLCHPRPGANDNASGVAALLGIASALLATRRSSITRTAARSIRFLWGPEFTGTAAFMYQRLSLRGRAGLPSAVINLDMVGEDQSLCGSPFIAERNPDHRPALLTPISEHVVGEVFAHTRSHHGTWRGMPFSGFSDHALFAGPSVGCAAIGLCHAPDPFNHSSGDSLDKVSPVEMLRAIAAGATLAQIMADDGALSRSSLEQIVRNWCADQHSASLRIARQHASNGGGEWGAAFVRYVDSRNASMLSLLRSDRAGAPNGSARWFEGVAQGPAALGCWSGPFNARAMMADLPRESRLRAADLVRADKRNLALLLNFAIRADGRISQNEVIAQTSFALQRPIDNAIARVLFSALIESGWVAEVPIKTAHESNRRRS